MTVLNYVINQNYIDLWMKYINFIQENIHGGMKTMRIDIPKKYNSLVVHFNVLK